MGELLCACVCGSIEKHTADVSRWTTKGTLQGLLGFRLDSLLVTDAVWEISVAGSDRLFPAALPLSLSLSLGHIPKILRDY